jgi:hypothetical protein
VGDLANSPRVITARRTEGPFVTGERLMARFRIGIAIVVFVLGLAASAGAQTAVKISQIRRSPGDYDRTSVAVSGTVKELSTEPEYQTFKICGSHCLWVLAWGTPGVENGQFMTVSGQFRIAKRIGPCTLRNIIVVQAGTIQ